MLNIFYSEPDPDRWFPYDRYPRNIIRRIVRGKTKIGGVQMVALELMRGLDKLGVPYRYNDYKYINKHPKELACVIGKPHVIFEKRIKGNPILFGAGVYSHPVDCPDLFEKYPNVQKILVPGEWMKTMFEPYYGNKVEYWPVGIDTEKWKPSKTEKTTDVLIYNKIRWDIENYENALLEPIKKYLSQKKHSFEVVRYGKYMPNELIEKVARAKSVVFLCEHETQGLAYQQILAADTPVFAWDRGGYWQDPKYFPHDVKFEPVSSVPYWTENCGMKFKDYEGFESQFDMFFSKVVAGSFAPRNYIMENLTLEVCAQKYLDIVNSLKI